jgi:DNA-binding beta-propeller fold protein YncE
MRTSIVFALIALIATSCLAEPPSDSSSLRLAATIALGSVEGRIDHMAVDGQGQRLYVAALGNNTIEVMDLKKVKHSATIDGLRKPQGIVVIPESGEFIVASGEDGKCRKYDAAQKPLGTIDGLDDADNVRFDPASKLVYVGYGDGALAVISAEKFSKLAEIKLAGHPESFQLEKKGTRIFVNVPDAGHIAVIDRDQQKVTSTWPVKAARANFPMALDEVHHRLFVGCRTPAKLLVIDTESGKTLATLDCCGDTDDVFYDESAQRVYVAGGEGCVSVFRQVDADTYKLVESIETAPGARTALFAPRIGQLFVAIPHRGNQRAEIRVYEVPSGKP